MRLEGSCQCKAIHFSVESRTPYPYMRCYCSICRKTGGGGGYAINLGADAHTLQLEDPDGAKSYFHAEIDGKASPAKRNFCSRCGSSLWLWDPRWPELIHPMASAIDTELPTPTEIVHIMLDFKPSWVDLPRGPGHVHFARYPDLSIEDWHKTHKLYEEKDET
ncbi:GFA family protein [Roseibium sp.]|uniref:GFA family protein n=1 Tax=Roseibium sp. TaxID=1936156 RepID=UPI003A976989